jgi:hypothetical protein
VTESRPEAGHTAAGLGGAWRNTMSKIHITFDDLCAFFTSKLSAKQLMVGMIQNQAVDSKDIHEPIITIKEHGQVMKEYRGFDEVQGKVFLYVYDDMNDELTEPSIQEKTPLGADQIPFNNIPDLEDHLYKGEPLTVKADLCKARLYFQHGELYAEGPTHPCDFQEEGSSDIISDLRLDDVPDKVALDIAIPTGGRAELSIENGTRLFIFNDGKDYVVEITNAPATGQKHPSHFLHFYEIVENLRGRRLLPIPDIQTVGPFCIESIFSKADFD